jgi:hypothetical protein
MRIRKKMEKNGDVPLQIHPLPSFLPRSLLPCLPPSLSSSLLSTLDVLGQVYVHSNTERKAQKVPIYPLFISCTAFPVINIHHQNGAFVIINGPTLTCHYYPKTIVFTLSSTLSVVNSMSF